MCLASTGSASISRKDRSITRKKARFSRTQIKIQGKESTRTNIIFDYFTSLYLS